MTAEYLANLAAPPIVGLLSQSFGLLGGLWLVVAFLALSFAVSGVLPSGATTRMSMRQSPGFRFPAHIPATPSHRPRVFGLSPMIRVTARAHSSSRSSSSITSWLPEPLGLYVCRRTRANSPRKMGIADRAADPILAMHRAAYFRT